MLRAGIVAGSTAVDQTVCRISVIRGPSNLAAAGTVGTTISPVANTNVLQIYYDREFIVPAVNTSATGYPVHLYINCPIKLGHLKFSGAAAGNISAESIFLIWSSNKVVGTTAPAWLAGNMEFYYLP